MDVWEQPEGGGGSGSGYLNFSTLCRRLLSCIPLGGGGSENLKLRVLLFVVVRIEW